MEVSAAHRAHTEKGHGASVNRLKANIWSTEENAHMSYHNSSTDHT